MTLEVDETRSSFLGWIIGNYLGVAALGAFIFIIPFLQSIPGIAASILIIGLPIGIAQWIALRRVTPISILWIFTISIGLLLALLVLRAVPDRMLGLVDDESIVSMVAGFTTMGFMIGLIQWFLLRRQFSHSLVWLLSSSIGIGMGSALVLASDLINISGFFSSILVVLVYASVTGLTLEWLRGQHEKSLNRLPNVT